MSWKTTSQLICWFSGSVVRTGNTTSSPVISVVGGLGRKGSKKLSINDELPEDFPKCKGELAEENKHLFMPVGMLIDPRSMLAFELYECAACGGNLMIGVVEDDEPA